VKRVHKKHSERERGREKIGEKRITNKAETEGKTPQCSEVEKLTKDRKHKTKAQQMKPYKAQRQEDRRGKIIHK